MKGIILILSLFPLLQNRLYYTSSNFVLGVDRSKFRSCQDTSFCRRHRFGQSRSSYKYQVLPDTIQFFTKLTPESNDHYYSERQPQNGEGLIATIMKNIVSSKNSTSTQGDPFFRGPSKIFSAKLINTSPITSTGESEMLLLNVHIHRDGVARIRLTELYGDKDTSFKDPRWTSDKLVLNLEEMIPNRDVDIISPFLNYHNVSAKNKLAVEYTDLVHKIFRSLSIHVNVCANNGFSDDNYVIFRYGDDSSEMLPYVILVLQLNPFSFYLWRENGIENPPLIIINSNNLIHFEVRRKRVSFERTDSTFNSLASKIKEISNNLDGDVSGDKKISQKSIFKEQINHLEKEDEIESKLDVSHVIGFREDGLAIFANGTLENSQYPKTPFEHKNPQEYQYFSRKNLTNLENEDLWVESFGDHIDSKLYGPSSIGVDITFPLSGHLYGLPEHASNTQLKTTLGPESYYNDPYRLYNLDVFEYELDEPMALYGAVPFIVSQSIQCGTLGIFWFNPTETFVDVEIQNQGTSTKTHWISESGVFDLFLLPGPNPELLYNQYAHLTGRSPLPPMFSLGYHQCRWNYRDEIDIYDVNEKFEELDYPYDVIWLDIEHTDGKRYFTWDKKLFPNPILMQDKLMSQGHRMVTIVDPHIKRDESYYIHRELTQLDLYIKDKSGMNDFDGWCWPGSSSYPDFTNERARSFWSDQFSYNKYLGSTQSLFIWNDMNEPSVFNGPEVSMPKDSKSINGVEHREWHNLYGQLFQRATSEGIITRNVGNDRRPFVLSRSFFAGSQKYGAIWTGDNKSSWSHLSISTPMLLSLNVAALSFVGADIGGFFGNPDAELMTRWMQTGAYQPFFRSHAHHDSKRREPWIFGEEWMMRMRKAVLARYSILPYWYTVFYKAFLTGMPVMRLLWMQYPKIEVLFSIDDQYLIGSDLLIKPVTTSGISESEVIFPLKDFWYDTDTMIRAPTRNSAGENEVETLVVKIGIDKIPVYQRGGSIVFRKLRLRHSTELMKSDPYTLYAALDNFGNANGVLYVDDGYSNDNIEKKKFGLATVTINWNSSVIRNTVSIGPKWDNADIRNKHMIERIIIMGVENICNRLTIGSKELDYIYDPLKKVLIVRRPNLSILSDWLLVKN